MTTSSFPATRQSPPRAARRDGRFTEVVLQLAIMAAMLGGVLYNAGLAFVAARSVPMNHGVVAATEALLLTFCVLTLFLSGLRRDDAPPIILMTFGVLITLLLSIMNDFLFLDGLRNLVIIGLFYMLGLRTDRASLRRTFLIVTVVVLGFLVLEIASTPAYVSVFHPADYYEKTRGVEQFSLDDSGLFRAALGFQSRFMFRFLTTHRTASVFIEQVSLANFAAVLSIFLLSMWSSLPRLARLLYVGTIVLILLSNSSRTSLALAFVLLAGYFVFPRLPRYLNLAVPLILLPVAVAITVTHPGHYEDDLVGRLSMTIRAMEAIDAPSLLGQRIFYAHFFMDSGYPYVIYSTTVFGLVALWAFVSFILPQLTPAQKRCAYGLSAYVFTNLLIGGTAIFSIKVAAPLWLLVGHMRRPAEDAPLPGPAAGTG